MLKSSASFPFADNYTRNLVRRLPEPYFGSFLGGSEGAI
jgi:hypothetical protein